MEDTEAQFYPSILTDICRTTCPLVIICFLQNSFHGDSQDSPPLSDIWDTISLKNRDYFF